MMRLKYILNTGIVLCAQSSAISIAIAQSAMPSQDTPTDISEVLVHGATDQPSYFVPILDGTKTDLSWQKNPQSVTAIPKQLLEDIDATRMSDSLDYVGGVTRQNDFGGMWDNYAIRGLPGNQNAGGMVLRNGLVSSRGFNAPRDAANIEQIVFLKGPAAALYGSSEPGGTLNIVTKQPKWKQSTSLDLSGTTSNGAPLNGQRAVLSTTGPVSKTFAYRLDAAVERASPRTTMVQTQRSFFAPALSWRPSTTTNVEYNGEFLDHRAPLDRGVLLIPGQTNAFPIHRFLGEPADGDLHVQNGVHQLRVQHNISENWELVIAESAQKTRMFGYSTEPSVLQADHRTLWRQRRYRNYTSHDALSQAELHGRIGAADNFHHDLTIGVQYDAYRIDQHMLRSRPTDASPNALDIFNPRYGQPFPALNPSIATYEKQQTKAFYAQDAITLPYGFSVVFGLRHDDASLKLTNDLTHAHYAQSPAQTSARFGVSYVLAPGWSIYANAGNSFRPNALSDVVSGTSAFQAPAPEKSNAYETGIKWMDAKQRMGGTLALFRITKRNVLTGSPLNPDEQIAAGQIQSQGIDGDFSGQIGQHWRVTASGAYNSVRVEKDNVLRIGSSIINIPRWTGSVFAVHEQLLHNIMRFGLGGGITSNSSKLGAPETQSNYARGQAPVELPGYGVFSLISYLHYNAHLRLSCTIENLFNRRYYVSAVAATPWVTPGNVRTITVGMHYTF